MNYKTVSLALALFGAVASASAVQLVTNGSFETKSPNGIYGAGWTTTANYSYADNSNFFDTWGDSPGGEISGASAYLNYLDDDDVTISQSINTTGYASATLSFDMYSSGYEFAVDPGDDPFDYLEVIFGGTVIDTIDLGSADGNTEFFLHPTYNLTPYLTGGPKTLTFHGVNDFIFASDLLIDHVSITATPVPEPATMAVLGLGAAAMLRRRRKA